jgi:cellobiose phosphorylase
MAGPLGGASARDLSMVDFRTKYGRFSPDGKAYVITTPKTPRPWINVISNGDYGLTMSQTGSGYSWRTHAQLNRVTRWEQDLIKDEWGKYLYLRDETGAVWSAGWKPVCHEPDSYTCTHGLGYSVIKQVANRIESELTVFVPPEDPCEVWIVRLRNVGRKTKTLDCFSYLEWGLGAAPDWHREFHRSFIETRYVRSLHALFATKRLWEVPTERGHWNTEWPYVAFHAASRLPVSYDADKESFLGMYGSERMPEAVVRGRLRKRTGNWLDAIGALHVRLHLKPRSEETFVLTLGAASTEEQAADLCRKYHAVSTARHELQTVSEQWEGRLSSVSVETPDPAMNLMENVWLKYQAISGRLWGRTAYYQTGGAFGFRDQLQDSQIFLPIDAERTKQQIQLHARHQFSDGSVYHWWHPLSEIGLRNQISDNLLWMPFVVSAYIEETADMTLLNERAPFVDDPAERSLYEHCIRAIEFSLGRFSGRGLPLIGAGDWNDGLSAVGLDMKGESVWLGHFLHRVLLDFAVLAGRRGDLARVHNYLERALRLRKALNATGWDGEWYWGATKDSGEKLGSAENTEGRIYLNAQTWAVIGGVADADRARQAMDMVEHHLLRKAGPLLLTPAYSTVDKYVGYLTRYAPGMRENGGVYTHAATWAIIAEGMLGRGTRAHDFYTRINPVVRGRRPDEYVAEPYVTSGNIEGPESPFFGKGGWTWYSGSAAWMWKAGLEWILGVRASFDGLVVDPCIPPSWKGYRVTRVFRGTTYCIEVRNPSGASTGVVSVLVDGAPLEKSGDSRGVTLPPLPSGTTHTITVTLGNP